LKLLGILVDWALEKTMDELLLVSPLSITYITILALVTFGADDFLDFIDAYFIEMGMMIFERTYLNEPADMFFEYVEETLPEFFGNLYAWLTNDSDEDQQGADLSMFFKKAQVSDSSDSKIDFSDDDSF